LSIPGRGERATGSSGNGSSVLSTPGAAIAGGLGGKG